MCTAVWLLLSVLLTAAEDAPPGLVSKDSDHDLLAQATQPGQQVAQKREAALSNSYGEPIPADVYGPPANIAVPEFQQQPAPVYGPPALNNHIFQTPPGAYGPPQPVVFPSQVYEGPPPPVSKPRPLYGPPAKIYGPPKQSYGPPKQIYGPPKKLYGPPKQSLPKPVYGVPFKPPKFTFPKAIYGAPKPIYGPPKQVYGPPKASYGPPLHTPGIPLSLPPVHIDNNIDLGLNLPAPIYGTPLPNLPLDLKPNFPIPADTYGPPGHSLGPVGPNDQVVVHHDSNIQYGPPQPDPNPRPPHPGIPAPPTPPHVLYDGWKPIPGVSLPPQQQQQQHHHHHHHQEQNIQDEYGPPPPVQEIHINLDQELNHAEQGHSFSSGAEVSTGYSSVHQDALANIDLKAIVGGESNDIDQSKTVFEAHYTENQVTNPGADLSFVQNIPSGHNSLEAFSTGHFGSSIRQQGAKGLIPPSGIYGVPPGSQYGAPPRPPSANLPIPYGSLSGGGHTGGINPRHPIKFREPVPEGLIQQVGHVTHHKDVHGNNHVGQGPAYLPPPVRDVKDVNQQTGNHGIESLSLSIEPSSLYSLPHSGNPLNFNHQVQQPSGSYGSPIDSYSVPLFTVDHTGSASSVNEVKATLDGNILANISNLEAAAILKHCPYHEAILKAAQSGDKLTSDLVSNYVASLSSLGSSLSNQLNQQVSISAQNVNTHGSNSISYNSKDLATASQTLVQSAVPNDIKSEKTEKNSIQKGKSMKDDTKNSIKDDSLKLVTDQILQTSERIKNLSEETKQLQQKIVSTSQNLNNVNSQIGNYDNIPVKGKHGSYSLQIQSSDGQNKGNPPIPHEQLLSEGLLQSILQAIEQPNQNQHSPTNTRPIQNYPRLDEGGLVLPAGYEPVDRTKEKNSHIQNNRQIPNQFKHIHQQQLPLQQNVQQVNLDQEIQSSNQDIKTMLHNEIIHRNVPHTECDLKADNSIKYVHIVPAPDNRDNINRDGSNSNINRSGNRDNSNGDIYNRDDNINNNKENNRQNSNKDSYTTNELSNRGDIPDNNQNDIDENDVAIYFDNKNDEQVTEISVATSISENVEQYSEKFGDKIKKKQ